MSEIIKLYENAGIEPDINYVCDKEPCEKHSVDCQECSHLYDTREDYPDFTAEKQIELIKWLAKRFNSDHMAYWHNEIIDVWIFQLYDLTEFSSEEPYIYEGRKKDFTEALCNLINNLWQDLTPEEKASIKNILEM